MAKDAKGHGSEKRGGGQLSVPDQHGLRIARQTLNMPDAMVGVMGGPNKQQAQATVDRLSDSRAATILAAGHPKSGASPVHSGAAGRGDASFSPRPGGLQVFDRAASVARKKSRPI